MPSTTFTLLVTVSHDGASPPVDLLARHVARALATSAPGYQPLLAPQVDVFFGDRLDEPPANYLVGLTPGSLGAKTFHSFLRGETPKLR